MKYISVSDEDYDKVVDMLNQSGIDVELDYDAWEVAFKYEIRRLYSHLKDSSVMEMASNLACDLYIFDDIEEAIRDEYKMYREEQVK